MPEPMSIQAQQHTRPNTHTRIAHIQTFPPSRPPTPSHRTSILHRWSSLSRLRRRQAITAPCWLASTPWQSSSMLPLQARAAGKYSGRVAEGGFVH